MSRTTEIQLHGNELSELIRSGCVVDLAIGPGWAALKCPVDGKITPAMRVLGLLRERESSAAMAEGTK